VPGLALRGRHREGELLLQSVTPYSPGLPSVENEVEATNGHSSHSQRGCRNIRINQLVDIVQQEAALIRLDSRFLFQPVLKQRQRTGPGQQLGENSPDQGKNMQPAKNVTRSREQGPKHHPGNEECVHEEDSSRKSGIDDWAYMHHLNLLQPAVSNRSNTRLHFLGLD
jgi:hypothetical protein